MSAQRSARFLIVLAVLGAVLAGSGAVMTIRYEAAARHAVTYHELFVLVLRSSARLPRLAWLAWLGVVALTSALSGSVVPAVSRSGLSRRWALAALVPGVNVTCAIVLLWRSGRARVLVVVWAVLVAAVTAHVASWWTVQRLPGGRQSTMAVVDGGSRVDERVRDAALDYQVAFPVRGWAGLLLIVAAAVATVVLAGVWHRGSERGQDSVSDVP